MAERSKVEPTPQDPQIFEWLERLFDGESEVPSEIQIWRAKGQNLKGQLVKQQTFGPGDRRSKGKKPDEEDTSGGATARGIPDREFLVAFSNEIIYRCQRDCDTEGREHKYNILVYQLSRMDDYYERWPLRLFPKQKKKVDDDDDDDEDGTSPRRALIKQSFEHNENLANLYGGAMESVVETLQEQNRALRVENETLRARINSQHDIIERLQSNQHQRDKEMRWEDFKIESVKRGFDLAMAVTPQVVNQIAGKQVMTPSKESPESMVLKEFFKMDKEGGKLTGAQCDAAFGIYDENAQPTKTGVLTPEQVRVLVDVANANVAPDALDKLIPGGELAVSMEQVQLLQKVFNMEQLAPIIALLGARMQRSKNPTPPTNGATP